MEHFYVKFGVLAARFLKY